jgi:hypothetical protein
MYGMCKLDIWISEFLQKRATDVTVEFGVSECSLRGVRIHGQGEVLYHSEEESSRPREL